MPCCVGCWRSSLLSNKLTKVTDNGTLGTNNGKLGDFADGTNLGDDYVYDANGNLIVDLNKNISSVAGGVATALGTSGIRYNFLDKPEEIRIIGKGTIKMIYDADGNRLQRSYTPDGGTAKVTSYINEYVYQDNNLQYINFEEGRLRVIQAVAQNNGFDQLTIDGNMDLPGSKRGAYDFFVRDYQSNVRMILTEETHTGLNICTMETSRAPNEEPVFGQAGAGNEVSATRTAKPVAWAANTSAFTSKLNSTAKKVGPNVLLKVMAGDLVNANAQYYYQNTVTNTTGTNNLIGSVLTSLLGSITGSVATNSITKGAAGNINTSLTGSVPFGAATAPDATNASGNNPKAYLTVLFFDERFNFISEGSYAARVTAAGDAAPALVLPVNTKAPKNGFAYIYVSNESAEPVYFDNLQVSQKHQQIIEEDHYYAFGLKIAAISSKKLGDINEGSLKNNNLYNDKELNDDADLNWYDYGFRSYDPQIGRFPQLDPLTDDYPELTPYQYGSNDPIANIDVDGLEGTSVVGDFAYSYNAAASAFGFIAPKAATLVKAGTSALNKAILGANVILKTTNIILSLPKLNPIRKGLDGVQVNYYDSKNKGTGRGKKPSEGWRDGGNALTSGDGAGADADENIKAKNEGPPINVDLIMAATLIVPRATPFERPDVTNPWAWTEIFGSAADAYTLRPKPVKAIKVAPVKYEKKVNSIDPVFKKVGNTVYNRGGGYTTKNTDGKGGGQLTNEKARDTFPKEKSFDYTYPHRY